MCQYFQKKTLNEKISISVGVVIFVVVVVITQLIILISNSTCCSRPH